MYLEKISSPRDVKNLREEELKILCHEVRDYIVQVTKKNGGHLASNLGIVELSVALLYVFETPTDKIIYDVGHQSYAHKILTGRREEFQTLRQNGGVAGFPKIKESPYDAYNTGHSSTSISLGYGMCKARDLLSQNHKIISVLGDGALSGGMSFEGLNNLADYRRQFLIVLNDNGMSISKNVGGISKFLSNARINKKARRVKTQIKNAIESLPNGKKIKEKLAIQKRKFFVKHMSVKFFEAMGIDYYGAIDGHNISELISFLRGLKEIDNPCIMHIKTTKGKGYQDAEESPEYFHGVSKDFEQKGKDFSQVCGDKLAELAEENEKIVAVSAAMVDGVGLATFQKRHPQRLFDVGICEGHAVTFCGGMAKGGLCPYFFVYSSFLQRGFDQLYHDIILPQMPITLLIDRAGIVGSDGETHQGVLDLGFLLSCGGIDIICPKDAEELEKALELSQSIKKPLAIRYPRGYSFDFSDCEKTPLEYATWEYLKHGKSDICIIAVGATMCENAILAHRKSSVDFSVINARFLFPMDEKMLGEIAEKNIIVLSDSNKVGGFGSVVESYFAEKNKTVKSMEINCLLESGSTKEQQEKAGLSPKDIVEMVEKYETR